MSEVHISELESQVDVVDGGALLSPAALRRIVEAVIAELEKRKTREKSLKSDIDTRSIVEQQRGGDE